MMNTMKLKRMPLQQTSTISLTSGASHYSRSPSRLVTTNQASNLSTTTSTFGITSATREIMLRILDVRNTPPDPTGGSVKEVGFFIFI
jgi:hypothetical protein